MGNAANALSTTRQPETIFSEMWNPIRDNLCDLAMSNDGEDGDDDHNDEDDIELLNLCEDQEPDWVTGMILKMVRYCM